MLVVQGLRFRLNGADLEVEAWDGDDPRYFSLVSPPGGPLIAGRVTKLEGEVA